MYKKRGSELADGNKRTALVAMVVFLHMNGWTLEIPDPQSEEITLEMIEQHRDKSWLATLLESKYRARPSWELRDYFQMVAFEQFEQFLQSFRASPDDEKIATLKEAVEAMPILGNILQQSLDWRTQGNSDAAAECYGRATTIFAFYRNAEDMGSEW